MNDAQASADLANGLYEKLGMLWSELKKRYPNKVRQVVAKDLQGKLRAAAEVWLVDLISRDDVKQAVGSDKYAALSVDFERLHHATEHSTSRKIYDEILKGILDSFQMDVVISVRRNEGVKKATGTAIIRAVGTVPTIFVGHSFLAEDLTICESITGSLRAIGFQVFTGEKPKSDRISEKVKELIDSQDIFVGIFTRRDKISKKNEWTTTMWVVEEKTWAMAKGKRLVLMRENGVKNIGGMHADHEYVDFKREEMGLAIVKLLEMFRVNPLGLR